RWVQPTSSTTLSTTIDQWNDVLGRPIKVTDPDGVSTTFGYDVLGRLTTMAKNSLPVHFRRRYAWTGDRAAGTFPNTSDEVYDGTLAQLAISNQKGQPSRVRRITHFMNGLMEPMFDAVPSGNPGAGTPRYRISGWKERDERGRTSKTFEPFYSTT